MRLRLYENYRFVVDAPFYAAHAIGAYATEGFTVELLPSPGARLAEQALLDGVVDVLWAGPMRIMKHPDENPGSALPKLSVAIHSPSSADAPIPVFG